MSYVPEVTARWKRRATEIADAIGGGESSSTVSGTVSLSAASITALADAIDDRLRLSAIAISIADVLSVKTNANDSVAVTGTVSATLPANLVIPVDTVAGTNNGANGSGVAVTVPVNAAHNVTIPVKTNSANQPMSSAGLPVSVPVDPVHSVTVPVKSNSSGQPLTLGNVVAQIGVAVGSTTVPVSVVTNTSQGASVYGTGVNVPVAGGLATIPVSNASGLTVQISNASGLVCDIANTNNVVVPVDTVSGTNNAANGSGVAVVVPVTASGTILDVKLVEVATLAQTSIHEAVEDALNDATGIDINIATVSVSAKTQFHEAMETALEEADVVDVNISTVATAAKTLPYVSDSYGALTGTIHAANAGYWSSSPFSNATSTTKHEWYLMGDDGAIIRGAQLYHKQAFHDASAIQTYVGLRYQRGSGASWVQPIATADDVDGIFGRTSGTIAWNSNDTVATISQSTWKILYPDGSTTGYNQKIRGFDGVNLFGVTRDQYTGHHVVWNEEFQSWTMTSIGADRAGIFGTVIQMTNQGGADPWWKVVRFGETEPEPTIYGNAPAGVFVGLNVIKNSSGNWVPSYQYD